MEPLAVPSDRKRIAPGASTKGIFRSADSSRTEYALANNRVGNGHEIAMAPANTANDAGWAIGADMPAPFGHRGVDRAAREGGKSNAVGTGQPTVFDGKGQGRVARRLGDQGAGAQGAQQQDR